MLLSSRASVKSESYYRLNSPHIRSENNVSPEALLTEEEVKNIVNQYLTSKRLLKTRDKNTINIAQDKLLLDIVSNGKEVDKAKLLEKKSMDVDEVIKKVVGSTKAWYKISTGDRQPVIQSVLHFQLAPELFITT